MRVKFPTTIPTTTIEPTLKYKLLHEDAIAPTRSHSGDLGYDLYALEDASIMPGYKTKVRTGVAFQFPEGWGGFVKDRSSMATKTTVETVGGVIDSGYTGELFIVFANSGKWDDDHQIRKGDKIAQMVLIQVPNFELEEVEEIISPDGRGENGFGSTGE